MEVAPIAQGQRARHTPSNGNRPQSPADRRGCCDSLPGAVPGILRAAELLVRKTPFPGFP